MRLARICLLAVLVTVAAAAENHHAKLWIGTGSDVIRDEFIITLKSRSSQRASDGVLSQIRNVGAQLVREHTVGNRRFAHVKANPSVIARLTSNPHIDMIESNTLIHLVTPVEKGDIKEYTSDHDVQRHKRSAEHVHKPGCHYDYPGGDGWGIIRTSHRDVPEDYETAPYIWGDGDDGEGVDIYVIDSGIRLDHDDFEGRAIWGKTGYGTTLPVEPDTDLNGHGTHVAGTSGGKRFGIARKATLIACKVLNILGSGVISDTIVMMEYISERMNQQRAAGKAPRAVMNQSYGGTASNGSYSREAAMQEVIDQGLLGASAAGNENRDTCRASPTRVASVFSVVASEPDDTVASFSNWGPCADIVAPGRNIMGPSHVTSSGYVAFSGTSMASPHVAGIAARFLSSLTEEEAAQMTAEKAKALITKVTTRGKVHFTNDAMRAGPNHLLYRECGNIDEAEPPHKYTTRPHTTPSPSTPSTPSATTPAAPEAEEDDTKIRQEIGDIAVGTFSLSAGVIGVSFGMMALIHSF